MDILRYKDYEGTAEVDMARMVCRGKILFIDDLVTYEAANPAQLQKEFENAVDDYLATCAALGRPQKRPLKGQFNVRVSPEIHKAAVLRATTDNTTLNEVTARALEAYVCVRPDVNHNVRVTVNMEDPVVKTVLASAITHSELEVINVH